MWSLNESNRLVNSFVHSITVNCWFRKPSHQLMNKVITHSPLFCLFVTSLWTNTNLSVSGQVEGELLILDYQPGVDILLSNFCLLQDCRHHLREVREADSRRSVSHALSRQSVSCSVQRLERLAANLLLTANRLHYHLIILQSKLLLNAFSLGELAMILSPAKVYHMNNT